MKRNGLQIFTIFLIAIAVFNVIFFFIPVVRNEVFWVLYGFTMFAFIVQPFIWHNFLVLKSDLKSKFLNLPIIYVAFVYLIVQIIASWIILANNVTESWIAVIACTIILGCALISLISGDMGIQEIGNIDENVKAKTDFMYTIKAKIDTFILNEENSDIKEALVRLSEQIQYSDPVSNEQLYTIEEEIKKEIENIDKSNDKLETIKKVTKLISERNNKCKSYK